ncbi:hypothetical protein [Aneurinibacillus uraniidurans]|nr:hypothetical protein [Aneurinibacillus sp. B1]WCN38227.1 hypothetical protein PO771_02080 [Aneurinibacillus sp. B1]
MLKLIGEVLLYFVGLPLFAFQTFGGLQSIVRLFADVSQYTNHY